MIDSLVSLLQWFVPPTGHDPGTELLYRWRVAVFGCLSFFGISFLFVALLFEWGPAVIRPASAQSVQTQVSSLKQDVGSSLKAVQGHLDVIEQQQHDDRVERLEQQLLWYRQQNCRSKGTARNYTWQKMMELRDRYRQVTGTDWQMPSCSDIGE